MTGGGFGNVVEQNRTVVLKRRKRRTHTAMWVRKLFFRAANAQRLDTTHLGSVWLVLWDTIHARTLVKTSPPKATE